MGRRRTRARYGDRGAGLGEAVAEEGSAGGLSSTCRMIICLFAMTGGDDQDTGKGGDEDLEAAQLLGAPIEVSWSPQVSQPLPERDIRNLP